MLAWKSSTGPLHQKKEPKKGDERAGSRERSRGEVWRGNGSVHNLG